jgi:hypothetical protein
VGKKERAGGGRGGSGKRGEMTQILYAHMNKRNFLKKYGSSVKILSRFIKQLNPVSINSISPLLLTIYV